MDPAHFVALRKDPAVELLSAANERGIDRGERGSYVLRVSERAQAGLLDIAPAVSRNARERLGDPLEFERATGRDLEAETEI